MRAIEVCLLSGMPYSSFRTKEKKNRSFNTVKIGLRCDRSTLYERINNRVDNMIADGLIEEAKSLYNHRALNALKTVGYSELFDYFDGVFSKKEAIEKIKQNTRRYAKRQLTWFNKDPNITWFDPSDTLNIYAFIDKLFLKNQEAG
jgi:tRNA dimethylallyltransferase